MMNFGHYLSMIMCLASSSAAALSIAVSDTNGMPVTDAVVTISHEKPETTAPRESIDKVSIQQIDRSFSPKINVLAVGQEVYFPNNDDVLHHVYSFSPTKTFEFALYGKDKSPGVTFDKAGLVVLGCNIHDQMRGYIFVTDAPYFALSDSNGNVDIATAGPDVYPQKYILKIWHPAQIAQQPLTETITIENEQKRELPLKFSLVLQSTRSRDLDRYEQGDYE